jgi:murein DD-endopeptidase MepM/ murein hydrolase activator NlpD
MLARVFLIVLLVALVVAPAAPASAAWRMPVEGGEVQRAFRHDARTPFAAGQRRGVEVAARAGETVHAACSGRVSFAGRVPGFGRGVSVRCGRLTATHLRLARVAVRRGTTVSAGAAVGSAGPSGTVRLGARVTAERFGYVDPLELIGPVQPRGGAPLGPAPRGRPPRPRPVAPPRPVRAPAASPVDALPWPAWVGLGLLAAGVGVGGLVRRRRGTRFRDRWAPSTSPPRSTT